jgi:hypothetical protein
LPNLPSFAAFSTALRPVFTLSSAVTAAVNPAMGRASSKCRPTRSSSLFFTLTPASQAFALKLGELAIVHFWHGEAIANDRRFLRGLFSVWSDSPGGFAGVLLRRRAWRYRAALMDSCGVAVPGALGGADLLEWVAVGVRLALRVAAGMTGLLCDIRIRIDAIH